MIAPERAGGTPGGAGPARASGPVAFVSDFRHISAPFEPLARVLRDPDAVWLTRVADRPAMRLRGASHSGEWVPRWLPSPSPAPGTVTLPGNTETGEMAPELLVVPGNGGSERDRHPRRPDHLTAASNGTSAALRVGVGHGPARLPVVVTIGAPRDRQGAVVVPLRWDPVLLDRFLPALDGDLELCAAGDEACRLGLSGRYRAPLEGVGWALDRLALRWVAESSVRDFLEAIEYALRALATPAPGGR